MACVMYGRDTQREVGVRSRGGGGCVHSKTVNAHILRPYDDARAGALCMLPFPYPGFVLEARHWPAVVTWLLNFLHLTEK